MKPERIVKNVGDKNSKNTRIFTFGVGDDVNAALLDQLADNTKALSTYVRPAEDIETKVTSLYGKISHPVLANLRLTTSENIKVHEIYPPALPDLFFGSQLVVLGKYTGNGPAAVKLTGQVGKETKEFAYDVNFAAKTAGDHDFVEALWARRKVGFLLDQIRINGEQKELMDEMLTLAKKYGIATPYTSYLVVPDAPVPVAQLPAAKDLPGGRPTAIAPINLLGRLSIPGGGYGLNGGFGGGLGGGAGFPGGPATPPPALTSPKAAGGGAKGAEPAKKVADVAKEIAKKPGDAGRPRNRLEDDKLDRVEDELDKLNKDLKKRAKGDGKDANKALDAETKAKQELAERLLRSVRDARQNIANYEQARKWYANGKYKQAQVGKVGVDVAICANSLRTQDRLTQTANCNVYGRNCLEVGGLWIDQGFTADMKTVVVKAQSDAYFKILEKYPAMKDVYRLGNHLVFVTPSKTALVIDLNDGKDKLTDAEIVALFTVQKEAKKAAPAPSKK